MQHQNSNVDRVIARIATRQHGVVTRPELLAAGITPAQIRQRLKRGSLVMVFPGVYRVGHIAPSAEAQYMAAVKACRGHGILGGRAAAWLWSLIRGAAPPPEVATRTDCRIPGLETRRVRLGPGETTVFRGIPVTSRARTIVDLAAVMDEEELARAYHEAHVRYRTQPEDIERVLQRTPHTKGAGTLRRVVRGDAPIILSRLEKRFRRLLTREHLQLPKTNVRIDAGFVDCRWPDHKLTVELDSYRYHATRHAFEQDRKRERDAYDRGDRFRRYTWGDVFEDPRAMLRELRELLVERAQ